MCHRTPFLIDYSSSPLVQLSIAKIRRDSDDFLWGCNYGNHGECTRTKKTLPNTEDKNEHPVLTPAIDTYYAPFPTAVATIINTIRKLPDHGGDNKLPTKTLDVLGISKEDQAKYAANPSLLTEYLNNEERKFSSTTTNAPGIKGTVDFGLGKRGTGQS